PTSVRGISRVGGDYPLLSPKMAGSGDEESSMPIKIMLTESGAAPVIICDVCGAWIERAENGAYTWAEKRTESGSLHEVAFVHKDNCFVAYEPEQGAVIRDMPLDVFLPFLAASLEVNWETATTLARYFSAH